MNEQNADLPDDFPPEPGEVPDTSLGVSHEEAGHPSLEPPHNDDELGDGEFIEGDGEDFDDDDEEDDA